MARDLAPDEREQLLRQPLVAVLATERAGGGVHAVPVWYLFRDGQVRVITGRRSAKARNAERSRRATLCIPRIVEDDLRYVTVEGSVTIEPCKPADRRELWAHYADDATGEQMSRADLSGLCVLVLSPERWTAQVE